MHGRIKRKCRPPGLMLAAACGAMLAGGPAAADYADGLAAIEAGASEAEVVADPNMTTEVEEVPAGDADANSEGNDEGGEPNVEAETTSEDEGGTPSVKSESDMVNTLFTKVGTLTEELAIANAKLSTAAADLVKAKSTEDTLKGMVSISINKMQVALGGTPLKLSDVDASVVIEQHNRTHSAFNQKYKVGASANVPESEDFAANSDNENENSVVEEATLRLTDKKVKQG